MVAPVGLVHFFQHLGDGSHARDGALVELWVLLDHRLDSDRLAGRENISRLVSYEVWLVIVGGYRFQVSGLSFLRPLATKEIARSLTALFRLLLFDHYPLSHSAGLTCRSTLLKLVSRAALLVLLRAGGLCPGRSFLGAFIVEVHGIYFQFYY